MLKVIYKLILRLIGAIMLIYSIDALISNLDIFLPINYFSVLLLTFLGLPGLGAFITLFMLI